MPMPMRSWMFVPGNNERMLAKVLGVGADAVVVDLEDSVLAAAKVQARSNTREFLELQHSQVIASERRQCWVRINGLETPHWRDDLAAVLPGKPDGIMVPKASGPEQLRKLTAEIYELEQKSGVANGATKIIPMAGETPLSAINVSQYAQPENHQPRIAGITWGTEDLSLALMARRKRDENGNWTNAFAFVRAQVLLAAKACEIAAIDTLYADFKDLEGLEKLAKASYADGFTGMLAIHPKQIGVINKAFSPDQQDIDRATAIVQAFQAEPGAGALQLDGEMIEPLHLVQAQNILAQIS